MRLERGEQPSNGPSLPSCLPTQEIRTRSPVQRARGRPCITVSSPCVCGMGPRRTYGRLFNTLYPLPHTDTPARHGEGACSRVGGECLSMKCQAHKHLSWVVLIALIPFLSPLNFSACVHRQHACAVQFCVLGVGGREECVVAVPFST